MSQQRQADLVQLCRMARDRAAKYVEMCDFMQKNPPTALALDQLTIGSGDLAGVLAVIGQRATDYAAELLDESEEA